MNTIELPALDGRSPLAFLAACGVLRLLDDFKPIGAPVPRLSWDERTGTALLDTDMDLDGVVEKLGDIASSMGKGVLLPGGPVGFPPAGKSGGPGRYDPMRMPACEFAERVASWRQEFGEQFVNAWVSAMVTDLAENDDGCVELTPFAAPSGRQTCATMFAKPLQEVKQRPEFLREALTGWRRVDGVTGEYLDHHVIRSAVDRSDGRSREAGVPGATWLALMSLPLFPAWSGGGGALAGGWQSLRSRHLLAWPLWKPPVDCNGVVCLTTHPALRVEQHGTSYCVAEPARLRALGVFLVAAAERQIIAGRDFKGVLTTVAIRFDPGREA